jgi:hypothetical protein
VGIKKKPSVGSTSAGVITLTVICFEITNVRNSILLKSGVSCGFYCVIKCTDELKYERSCPDINSNLITS